MSISCRRPGELVLRTVMVGSMSGWGAGTLARDDADSS